MTAALKTLEEVERGELAFDRTLKVNPNPKPDDDPKIVETLGLDPRSTHDAGIVLEEAEDLERRRTGHECARPAGIGTEVERVRFAVAYRIGKIGLGGSLLEIQLGEGRWLWFEAGDATQLCVQKRSVRRRAVDWICADIHDMSQTAHAEEARHIMSA